MLQYKALRVVVAWRREGYLVSRFTQDGQKLNPPTQIMVLSSKCGAACQYKIARHKYSKIQLPPSPLPIIKAVHVQNNKNFDVWLASWPSAVMTIYANCKKKKKKDCPPKWGWPRQDDHVTQVGRRRRPLCKEKYGKQKSQVTLLNGKLG